MSMAASTRMAAGLVQNAGPIGAKYIGAISNALGIMQASSQQLLTEITQAKQNAIASRSDDCDSNSALNGPFQLQQMTADMMNGILNSVDGSGTATNGFSNSDDYRSLARQAQSISNLYQRASNAFWNGGCVDGDNINSSILNNRWNNANTNWNNANWNRADWNNANWSSADRNSANWNSWNSVSPTKSNSDNVQNINIWNSNNGNAWNNDRRTNFWNNWANNGWQSTQPAFVSNVVTVPVPVTVRPHSGVTRGASGLFMAGREDRADSLLGHCDRHGE